MTSLKQQVEAMAWDFASKKYGGPSSEAMAAFCGYIQSAKDLIPIITEMAREMERGTNILGGPYEHFKYMRPTDILKELE